MVHIGVSGKWDPRLSEGRLERCAIAQSQHGGNDEFKQRTTMGVVAGMQLETLPLLSSRSLLRVDVASAALNGYRRRWSSGRLVWLPMRLHRHSISLGISTFCPLG